MNLLLFNLATDADDPVLGFTTAWLRALAPHCDHIHVITVRRGRLDLPDNVSVYSVGKEQGYGKLRRGAQFYRHLTHVLRSGAIDACFAHMSPLFAVMAAPLLKVRRIPITLWYAHKSVTWKLRVAEKLANQAVTSSPEGFRIPSRKVIVIGQGIDTDVFAPLHSRRSPDQTFTITSVGRVSPIKRLEILIEASRILVHEHGVENVKVRLVGPIHSRDAAYAEGLRRRVAEYDLDSVVEFAGPVPFERVVDEYRQADVAVNLSPTGAPDKAVLEAMSCGTLAVVGNEAFRSIFRQWAGMLLIPDPTPTDLANRLLALAQCPRADRVELGQRLRRIVIEEHSLQELARRLAEEILLGRHSLPRTYPQGHSCEQEPV